MEKQSLERILIENELGKAIKREQLDLQYRPKFDFTSGGLAGVELFVRWFHPELGEIKPETFMPLAEETGLIVPLGEWMLKKGCEQYQEWKAKGYSPPTVTIHLTERQLKQKNLAEEIGVILTETGMNPDRLELEMTENTLAGIKQASDILQEIKRWGVQLSINQFGIGNSVISYLHHLPADSVKLDPAFMKNIGLNDKSSAVVKAVVSLAQALGIKVIAENIEHQGKLDFLNGETTEQIQGIVSGKPLGMDEFEYLLKENAFMCL